MGMASCRGDLLFLKDVGNVTEWLEERARKIYAPRPVVQAGLAACFF